MSDQTLIDQTLSDPIRIDPWTVDLPISSRPGGGMRVPARVFADEVLFEKIRSDRSLEQLLNVATLPGITGHALAMPDAHEGYGFPVGGVAAFRTEDGIISPGGVGYDINCGVRLLASGLEARAIEDRLEHLVHELSRTLPSGTGRGGELVLDDQGMEQVLARGSRYLVDRGLATEADVLATEAHGSLATADPSRVSDRAKRRGRDQMGSIGSGNHFVEIQRVERVFDREAAAACGIQSGQVVVLVHTGSRGLGHQVCTDYVKTMDAAMSRHGITLPDRQLACAPFRSPEGQAYFGAMCAAANFAWANRQALTWLIRGVFRRVIGGDEAELRLVYDVAHNMAKLEDHGGGGRQVVVHRKGATRAFGPSHPETPEAYARVGQPVFIPGSMGTASFMLAGTDRAMERSFGSCCHGAGRAMSRRAAKRMRPGHEVREELEARGIVVRCPSNPELAEEAPFAYKDVERVAEVVEGAGLARRVARLRPMGVIKG